MAEELKEYEFIVSEESEGERADKYLTMLMDSLSRSYLQKLLKESHVTVGGQPVKANYRIKTEDAVRVLLPPLITPYILPENIPLEVLYEDEDVIVVNKPKGMVVHPAPGHYSGTLVNALAYYFRDTPDYDVSDPRLGLVHRIDKDTSGLLVIAKTPEAKTNLGLQFFHKTTQRQYVALVWGIMEKDEGTITGNIGRSLKDRLQMTVFPEGDFGKHAVTHYKTLERLGYVSIVECKLETGRTHQIRVHMKHIGHTLFNDERYGGDQILKGTTFTKYKQFVQNCVEICPRQALHAKTLGFKHPVTGEEMFFDSPIPQDMTLLFDKWRNYTANRDI